MDAEHLGYVGVPTTINVAFLRHLLSGGYLPVISPVSRDASGNARIGAQCQRRRCGGGDRRRARRGGAAARRRRAGCDVRRRRDSAAHRRRAHASSSPTASSSAECKPSCKPASRPSLEACPVFESRTSRRSPIPLAVRPCAVLENCHERLATPIARYDGIVVPVFHRDRNTGRRNLGGSGRPGGRRAAGQLQARAGTVRRAAKACISSTPTASAISTS